MKVKSILTLGLLCLVSCGGTETGNPIHKYLDESHPTASPTGNPDDENGFLDVTYLGRIRKKICEVLLQCYPSVQTYICLTEISQSKSIDTEVGLTKEAYLTYGAAEKAEGLRQLVPNNTSGNQCLTDLSQLQCTDPQVQSAYSNSIVGAYVNIQLIFPTAAGSCSELFDLLP